MKLTDLENYVKKNFREDMANKPGIYCFVCTNTAQFYVGKTKHVMQRKEEHLDMLRKKRHHSYKFQRAWDEHGENAFKFYVIEYVTQLDKLDILEPYWINKLDSIKNGLNVQEEVYNYENVNTLSFDKNLNETQRIRIIENMSKDIFGQYFNLNSYPTHKIAEEDLFKLIEYLRGEKIDEVILREVLEYLSVPSVIQDKTTYYFMYDLNLKSTVKRRITIHNKEIWNKIECYYNAPIRRIDAEMREHAMEVYLNFENINGGVDYMYVISTREDFKMRKEKLLLEKAKLEEEVIKIY